MLSVSNKRCDPPTFDDPSKYQVNKKYKVLPDNDESNVNSISKRKRDIEVVSESKHYVTEYDQRSYLKRKSGVDVTDVTISKRMNLYTHNTGIINETNETHVFEWNSKYNTNQYDPIKLVYI